MVRILIFLALLMAATGYAFWRGGRPERIAAAAFIAAYALTIVARSAWTARYVQVDFGIFAVDTALLAVFIFLALVADRYWPICLSALQAMPVVAHLVKFFDPTVIAHAYQVALALWSYPMVAVLAAATWRHRRRLKSGLAEPSWSRSSSAPVLPRVPPPG